MTTSDSPLRFSAIRRRSLLTLGCALGLAALAMPAVQAADAAPTPAPAAVGPALPLSSSFEKVANAESGPFVLKLKNDSKSPIKISTKILLAVAFHADNKARKLPDHVIEAGQVWLIPDLAGDDKVILTAEGFAPLTISVPFKLPEA